MLSALYSTRWVLNNEIFRVDEISFSISGSIESKMWLRLVFGCQNDAKEQFFIDMKDGNRTDDSLLTSEGKIPWKTGNFHEKPSQSVVNVRISRR